MYMFYWWKIKIGIIVVVSIIQFYQMVIVSKTMIKSLSNYWFKLIKYEKFKKHDEA